MAEIATMGFSKERKGGEVDEGGASKEGARANWITKDVEERRRSSGQYLCCGAGDHRRKPCALLPLYS